MECAVIAERREIELQGFALHDQRVGHIVDYQMGEIGLARHRAERGEFGRGEADHIQLAGARIGDVVEFGLFGRGVATVPEPVPRSSGFHAGPARSI